MGGGRVVMSEGISTKKYKLKNLLQRLGLAELGGIIGAFIVANRLLDSGISIQGFLREGFVLFLPSALLSLPAALIKRRAVSFAVALLVGVIVSFAISSIVLSALAAAICGMGAC